MNYFFLTSGIFFLFSTFMYIFEGNDKCFSRLVLSMGCFAVYVITKQLEKILNQLKENKNEN